MKNLLDVIASFLEEHGCSTSIYYRRNYISFSPKSLGSKRDNYKLLLQNSDARISRLKLVNHYGSGSDGRPYYTPEYMTLLSVDLYCPKSLGTIRDWLKTL